MNSIIFSCLGFFALITVANGISCIVCTSGTSGCSDPYSGGTSLSQSASYIGCYKYVYSVSYSIYSAGYVGRGGYTSGYTCTPGTNSAGATYYCCTDKDNCNGAMGHTASFFAAIFLTITSLLAKRMFFG